MRNSSGAAIVTILFFALTPNFAAGQDGWPLYRGNAQRTAEAAKLPLEKRSAWQRPLFNDKLDYAQNIPPDEDELAEQLIKNLRKNADATTLPAFFPLISHRMCLYVTHRDLRTVSLYDLNLKDKFGEVNIRASEICWKTMPSNPSISVLLNKQTTRAAVQQLAEELKKSKQDIWLWANPLIGSMNADEEAVYSVVSLANSKIPGPKPNLPMLQPVLNDYAKGNWLLANDAENGKLLWDSGDAPGTFGPRKSPFDDTHFLGSPLPLSKKLYVLNEKGNELRLLTINRDRKTWRNPSFLDAENSLTLLNVPAAEQVAQHPMRRTQPLHIAATDDLLVCPTNAGTLFGVDRAALTVRWQYLYRNAQAARPELPFWQAACPVIFKDGIVFTAADSPDVHCIGLDGKKRWTATLDGDLYLATVHDDIVLLVGKKNCRALALKDGKQKWTLNTGLPAGVGVKEGGLYYLPLRQAAGSDGPAIWAIDLAKGTKAHAVEMPFPDALGNLILHRGLFVSQSVSHIAAFPLKAK